tara:strand:- start:158 stop:985 length:828 start_codon:yes stop_codon:yes gene_type:complete
MIFTPKGIYSSEIIDPTALANDFLEGSKIMEGQTQYQWSDDMLADTSTALPHVEKLVRGGPVTVHTATQVAYVKGNTATPSVPQLHRNALLAGFNPNLTAATGDGELFHIPYNRGMHLITGTRDMSISWTSQYQEMVFAWFSFQYVRRGVTTWNYTDDSKATVTPVIRAQFELHLDGAPVYGTGIRGSGTKDGSRGQGWAGKAMRTTMHSLSFVGAGSHTFEAHAGQVAANPTSDLESMVVNTLPYLETPPDEGVCVAHRTLTVMRFPKSKMLGG